VRACALLHSGTLAQSHSVYRKNIHLYIFRNLNFVFSVLICRSLVFCILASGSGQRLLYRLGSWLGLVLVLVLRFCAYRTQLWRCIFLMCPTVTNQTTCFTVSLNCGTLTVYLSRAWSKSVIARPTVLAVAAGTASHSQTHSIR